MTELLPARRGPLEIFGQPREVSRALRYARGTAVATAARVEAVAAVTDLAYGAVARLAEKEARLVYRSPVAEARLRYVGNIGAARVGELIERMFA